MIKDGVMVYCDECSSYICGCPEANEIESLRQQLTHREAQIVMLRDALWNQLNDCINFNGGELTTCIMEASTEALAATDDLSGYILCEREPVSSILQASGNPLPLYRAKEQGK